MSTHIDRVRMDAAAMFAEAAQAILIRPEDAPDGMSDSAVRALCNLACLVSGVVDALRADAIDTAQPGLAAFGSPALVEPGRRMSARAAVGLVEACQVLERASLALAVGGSRERSAPR